MPLSVKELYRSLVEFDRPFALFSVLKRAAMAERGSREWKNGLSVLKTGLPRLSDIELKSFTVKMKDDFENTVAVRDRESLERLADRLRILLEDLHLLKPGKDWLALRKQESLMRLQQEMRWQKVQLMSHGAWPAKTSRSSAAQVRKNLQSEIESVRIALSSDPLDYTRDRMEKLLIHVQGDLFNTFRFHDVIDHCETEYKKYREISALVRKRLPVGPDQLKDSFIARISGTLAQSHVFIACTPGMLLSKRNTHLTRAEELLRDDIANSSSGTSSYQQAVNYLVSLLIEKSDLRGAAKEHFRHLIPERDPPIDPMQCVSRFGRREQRYAHIGKERDWFVFLNHLRLAATAMHAGQCSIFDQDVRVLSQIVSQGEMGNSEYPRNLVAKWAAYIFFKCDRRDLALDTLRRFVGTGDEPVLLLMRALNLVTLAVMSGVNATHELQEANDLVRRALEHESINQEYLMKYPWIEALLEGRPERIKKIDVFQLMKGLPFYYG